jgi:flagellar motility protein MotE (MotC chaperone)
MALGLILFGLALTSVSKQESSEQAAKSEEKKADAQSPAAHPVAVAEPVDPTSGSCIVNAAAIEDLQRRREELENRHKELAAREAELNAREKVLNDEIGKLQQIRDDIAKIEDARKKEGERSVAKLVETIEGMSPKSAAQLLVVLDDSLAVAAISRISTQRLSKIMNVLDPGRASRLTELLAGVVRARNQGATAKVAAQNAAAAATIKREGGEKNDGINQQQSNAGDSKHVADRGASAEKGKGSGQN